MRNLEEKKHFTDLIDNNYDQDEVMELAAKSNKLLDVVKYLKKQNKDDCVESKALQYAAAYCHLDVV